MTAALTEVAEVTEVVPPAESTGTAPVDIHPSESAAIAAPPMELAREIDPSAQLDTPDVPMRPVEKKRLHWEGLTCMLWFSHLLCNLLKCGMRRFGSSNYCGKSGEWSISLDLSRIDKKV
jgi:tRNA-dihydrouridine synthase 3